MTDPIPSLLVRRANGPWREPAQSAYDNEAKLRDLLADKPDLLPGLFGRAAAVTEFGVPGTGSVDVVAVSEAGEIAIVECKLASSPEIRRKVVGQVLDYAAALWRASVESFEDCWRSRHPEGEALTRAVLGQDHTEAAATELRANLASALEAGRFSLVLAADEINEGLRRMVEYLNAHTLSGISVLAIELRYAREADVDILIPRVYGEELATAGTRHPSRPRWTEANVLDAVGAHGDAAREAAQHLLDHYRSRVSSLYFGLGTYPSVTGQFTHPYRCQPWTIYGSTAPTVGANFEYTTGFSPAARRRFVEAVARIWPEVKPDAIEADHFKRRPSVPIVGVLDRTGAMKAFIAAVDELIESEGTGQLEDGGVPPPPDRA